MKINDDGIFKICVCLPEEFLEKMMDSVNAVMGPVYPGYERAFSYSRATGTWIPLENSNPYKGKTGETEVADEVRLEFVAKGRDIKNVIKAIVDIHPYEEPAIDVTSVYDWKEFI